MKIKSKSSVCFKSKNYILMITWLSLLSSVCYKVENKLFMNIKVLRNRITFHNFYNSYKLIPV